jgi:hypothetical protein
MGLKRKLDRDPVNESDRDVGSNMSMLKIIGFNAYLIISGKNYAWFPSPPIRQIQMLLYLLLRVMYCQLLSSVSCIICA